MWRGPALMHDVVYALPTGHRGRRCLSVGFSHACAQSRIGVSRWRCDCIGTPLIDSAPRWTSWSSCPQGRSTRCRYIRHSGSAPLFLSALGGPAQRSRFLTVRLNSHVVPNRPKLSLVEYAVEIVIMHIVRSLRISIHF